MLKRFWLSVIVTALAFTTMQPVYADELESNEEVTEVIQTVEEEQQVLEITTDETYNVEVNEEAEVDEAIIDETAIQETTDVVEEEMVVEETIETEDVISQEEEVLEVLEETLEVEETTPETEEVEEEPAPLMLMAAPKMAMLGAKSSKAATNDPSDPENFDILNNYGPIYVTISWTEFIHAKFATNISYNFTGDGWEQVVSEFTTVSQAYGSYKLTNKSLNNIYVHMNYTPVVEGTNLKLFKDASFNGDGTLDTNLKNWSVEDCEYRRYDIDGDNLRAIKYTDRYISYMKVADLTNQYWCAALSGYGVQRGPGGVEKTQVVPETYNRYMNSTGDYREVVNTRDKVCSYMGWWCVRWDDKTINKSQLSASGGTLGTVTFRIDEVLENYGQFFTK